MSLLVYGIAIPFFLEDRTSLPLTVGFLAGLMWVPLSWIIQHWIGIFHAVARPSSLRVAPTAIFGQHLEALLLLLLPATYAAAVGQLRGRDD